MIRNWVFRYRGFPVGRMTHTIPRPKPIDPAEPPPPRPEYHWLSPRCRLVFITFCLEIGLFR